MGYARLSNDIIGVDLRFPLQTDGRGRLALISGNDNLAQAIIFWIMANVGEVMYHRSRGIGAVKYVHLLIDKISTMAPAEIETGLMQWEKRLERVKVHVDGSGRTLSIHIRFRAINYAIDGSVTIPIMEANQ